jgi:hypothetical protein
MQTTNQAAAVSTKRAWAGTTISGLAILFLLFDGSIKLANPAPVVESFAHLGYPGSLALGIGILELVCTLIYAIPRTSVLGAVLLTGFLGGAISTHVRVGDPLLTHVFFPVYIGALVWAGVFLREGRLRELIPLRS